MGRSQSSAKARRSESGCMPQLAHTRIGDLGSGCPRAYVFDHNRRNGRVRPFPLVRLSSQASKSARLVVRRRRPAATRFHRAAWARSSAAALAGRVPAETSNGRSLESVATGSGLRISIRGRSIVGTAKLSAVGSRSSELSSMLQRRDGAAESSCRLPTYQTTTIVTQPLTPIGLMGWHQMPRSAFARCIRRC
jgi:hypothetical protein